MATKLREMYLGGEIEEVTEPVYLELMEEIARASGPVTILGGDEDEEGMGSSQRKRKRASKKKVPEEIDLSQYPPEVGKWLPFAHP